MGHPATGATTPSAVESDAMHALYLRGGQERGMAPHIVYADPACPHDECEQTLHAIDFNGAEITSNTYRFPIRLCDGCLFACQRDATGNAIERPSCAPGQDAITLTCR